MCDFVAENVFFLFCFFTTGIFFDVLFFFFPRSGRTLYKRTLALPLLSLSMKEGKSKYLTAPLP